MIWQNENITYREWVKIISTENFDPCGICKNLGCDKGKHFCKVEDGHPGHIKCDQFVEDMSSKFDQLEPPYVRQSQNTPEQKKNIDK